MSCCNCNCHNKTCGSCGQKIIPREVGREVISPGGYGGMGEVTRITYSDGSTQDFTNTACFYGLVQTGPYSYDHVANFKPGDRVRCSDGHYHTIRYIVRSVAGPGTEICKCGDLLITPWHPIQLGESWEFPDVERQYVDVPYVYNLVVDGASAIKAGKVNVITLGHGIQDDSVASHDFFGTNKVVETIRSVLKAETGIVELEKGCSIRGPDGRVIGWDTSKMKVVEWN